MSGSASTTSQMRDPWRSDWDPLHLFHPPGKIPATPRQSWCCVPLVHLHGDRRHRGVTIQALPSMLYCLSSLLNRLAYQSSSLARCSGRRSPRGCRTWSVEAVSKIDYFSTRHSITAASVRSVVVIMAASSGTVCSWQILFRKHVTLRLPCRSNTGVIARRPPRISLKARAVVNSA